MGEFPLPKVRVRELARRLTIVSNITITADDIVQLGAAAELPINPTTSALDERQVVVLLQHLQYNGDRAALTAEVMNDRWRFSPPIAPAPPPPAEPAERPSWNRRSAFPAFRTRPLTARPPAPRPEKTQPPVETGPVISKSALAAARAARPGPPPPRPFLPLPTTSRQSLSADRRRPSDSSSSIRVDDLSPMARVMMPASMRGRPRVSRDEAEHLKAEARAWAEEGFHEGTARRWHLLDLSPRVAGFLARRHVDPDVLDVAIPVPCGVVVDGQATAAFLLAAGRLPVEVVYTMLVDAHLHTPATETTPLLALSAPSQAARSVSLAPPALFSAPGEPDTPAPYVAPPARRRRARPARWV